MCSVYPSINLSICLSTYIVNISIPYISILPTKTDKNSLKQKQINKPIFWMNVCNYRERGGGGRELVELLCQTIISF